MSETLVHVASGKVRELFTIDDERLLLVASDRISTFDVVLPTEIPDKGRVLTGLSRFWFDRTASIVPNPRVIAARPISSGITSGVTIRPRDRLQTVTRATNQATPSGSPKSR